MFHNISSEMLSRMRWLENEDARDRQDGTPRQQRLRQVPAETGKFLTIMAANSPDGGIVEVGTSAGYSTLWLVLAAIESGRTVSTFEILNDKVRLAQETFRLAGVAEHVNLFYGDARQLLKDYDDIGFCFLDAEKEDYEDMYDMVVPRLVTGGLLVADNVISHAETLKAVVEKANSDERVDSVVVPIGKGELVCRRTW